jgi:hypothetical protein
LGAGEISKELIQFPVISVFPSTVLNELKENSKEFSILLEEVHQHQESKNYVNISFRYEENLFLSAQKY